MLNNLLVFSSYYSEFKDLRVYLIRGMLLLQNKGTAKRSIFSRHEILWRKMPKLFRNVYVIKFSSKFCSSIRSNSENNAQNLAACFDESGMNLISSPFQF